MNSNDSRRSSFLEVLGVAILLLGIVSAAAFYFSSSGYLLYYGDAQAHLNNSRSLVDGRQTGYDQLGTVWLPVLHLICLPFVVRNHWWESGLAGTIPVTACFVIAGLCLYLCGKDAWGSSAAALVGLLCFALNPNVLYLAAIPMTETVFVAGLAFCLLSILWFSKTQHKRWIAMAVAASWWMSLTRYDGWFLIPFIALFLAAAAEKGKLKVLLASGCAASLAPLYWIAHNWWETSNPLDFYNGPYSAAAIQKFQPYPGFHDWPAALHYYFAASNLCAGYGLLAAGGIGVLVALGSGRWKPLCFLALTPLFYVWSIHGSWTPIHVPGLYPFSYYNTRYAIAVVVLLAFAAGGLASVLPPRIRFLPLLALLPWLWRPGPDNWICWKESQVNSVSRRAWTAQAAEYLSRYYHRGDGVLMEFGDMAGILPKAGLPFREAIHEGSGPAWFINTLPSGLVTQTRWAIAQKDDMLARRLKEAKTFHVVDVIAVQGAPDLLIYERN